jgi:hypothetical protein
MLEIGCPINLAGDQHTTICQQRWLPPLDHFESLARQCRLLSAGLSPAPPPGNTGRREQPPVLRSLGQLRPPRLDDVICDQVRDRAARR